jgi:hypothetical protein
MTAVFKYIRSVLQPGEQAGTIKGAGGLLRRADCLPAAERFGGYTSNRSNFCPACSMPLAEHLGLVGTCALLQEALAEIELLKMERALIVAQRDNALVAATDAVRMLEEVLKKANG